MLSREYVLDWLDRTVSKIGKGGEFWKLQGKEVSAKSVANMVGCHYSYVKYVARGKRKLSVNMHRKLAGAIQSIESGEVVILPTDKSRYGIERELLKVERPRPRLTVRVNIAGGLKLKIAPPVPRPDKMPALKDAFKRK